MNDRTKSDLLFDEDDELMDALEEAMDKLSEIRVAETETTKTRKVILKKDEKEKDLPLLIF